MGADSLATVNVVAVMVTRNPGPWFEDALAALAVQDLLPSILVIDDGSAEPVTARVASVVPSAYVRRHDRPTGFAAAANNVQSMVQGADYYLFVHDDVALAPDVVRLLVAEAERAEADLVGPKVVAWDNHERLLSIGETYDRSGRTVPLVEAGEVDQGQHDTTREVVGLSTSCILIRVAAFTDLHGFDEAITAPYRDDEVSTGPDVGEDIDLCWRARQQGKRIVVQPAARIAHVGTAHGSKSPDARTTRLALRRVKEKNRIRTMFTTASGVRLPFIIPVMAVQTGLHDVSSLLRRGGELSGTHAWRSFLSSLGSARTQRKVTQRARTIGERDFLRVLPAAGARTRAAIRNDVNEDTARAWMAAERAISADSYAGKILAAAALVFGVFLLLGSRNLLTGQIPSIGQFGQIPGPGTLWRLAWSGWREGGTGSSAPASPAITVLAILTTLALGSTGFVLKLLTFGMIPVGLIGTWRLAGALGDDGLGTRFRVSRSTRITQVAATFSAASIPLMFDAIGRGHLFGVVSVGVAPWLLRPVFLREPGVHGHSDERRGLLVVALRIGLPLALVSAFVPPTILAFIVVNLGLTLGSLVAGDGVGTTIQRAKRAVSAIGVALLLLAPWSIDLLRSGSHWYLVSGGHESRVGMTLWEIVRFDTGQVGNTPLALLPFIAALSPLLIADGERLRMAIRLWGVILVGVAAVWVGGRGWFPSVLPSPTVLLAPVALSVAICIGIGIAGFLLDATNQQFGWRQWLLGLAVVSIGVSTLPVVYHSLDGQWHLPQRGPRRVLSWLDEQSDTGSFRTVWIGSPQVLPGAGWRVGPNLAMAISQDGVTDMTDQWGTRRTQGVNEIITAVNDTRSGDLRRVGERLTPWGVRYIVVMSRLAPGEKLISIPSDLRRGLSGQLDLRQIDAESGYTVFENTEWLPLRAAQILQDDALEERRRLAEGTSTVGGLASQGAAAVPLSPPTKHNTTDSALVPQSDVVVVVRSTYDEGWRLNGQTALRTPQKTMAFVNGAPKIGVAAGSEEEVRTLNLSYRTPTLLRVLLGLQAVLWLLALSALARSRVLHESDNGKQTYDDDEDTTWADFRAGDPFLEDDFGDTFGDAFGEDDSPDDDLVGAFDEPVMRPRLRVVSGGRTQVSRDSQLRNGSGPDIAAGESRVSSSSDGERNGDTALESDDLWEQWSARRLAKDRAETDEQGANQRLSSKDRASQLRPRKSDTDSPERKRPQRGRRD